MVTSWMVQPAPAFATGVMGTLGERERRQPFGSCGTAGSPSGGPSLSNPYGKDAGVLGLTTHGWIALGIGIVIAVVFGIMASRQ